MKYFLLLENDTEKDVYHEESNRFTIEADNKSKASG